jgi:cell filamentation protein
MTFDPFGDFDRQGYLRNIAGSKDLAVVKQLEHVAFQIGLDQAISELAKTTTIKYQDILRTHQILFGDVYPWAGQDRLATAPDINITRDGYDRMFASPQDVRRAMEYALEQGRDPAFMAEKPGEVMGSLAHGHPFLDGNGRTIMVVHGELAYRAGISIDWLQTDKTAYLTALTEELYRPGSGHLDVYLQPFVKGAINRQQSADMLKSLKSLRSGET